jgi:DNA polymerase I-like protein with 3'-5' exonuclease and polymerase domains
MTVIPNTAEAYQLFHDGILAIARAEMQGMRIDLDYVEKTKQELSIRIEKIEKQLFNSSFYRHWEHTVKGIPNISSDKQLAYFLYNVRKLKPTKTTASGQGSTDDEALKSLKLPELDMILEVRKLKKIRDTYLEAFAREQVKGYIHPQFNLHNVVTYRSSSDSPNFQNIPKRDKEAMNIVRNAIFPRPGNQLMEVDFSSLEVSIAACYHKDPVMIKYLTSPHTDMHGDMAMQIFKLNEFDKHTHKTFRQAAKNAFVFPQFYGDYYKNNAIGLCQWIELGQGVWKNGQGIQLPDGKYISNHLRSVNINCFNDFVEHLQKVEQDFWQRRFRVYAKWKEKWYAEYMKNGFMDSYTGFRFRGEMRRNEVINYPVQGAAFHCLLWCFIRLDAVIREKGWGSKLIGQIHDALVIDVVPDELQKISKMIKRITTVELAQHWRWINVPLSVEADLGTVNGSWATLEEYKLP